PRQRPSQPEPDGICSREGNRRRQIPGKVPAGGWLSRRRGCCFFLCRTERGDSSVKQEVAVGRRQASFGITESGNCRARRGGEPGGQLGGQCLSRFFPAGGGERIGRGRRL